uniref:Uncharacterized protein n=1 Tax=Arundo donax TaxID=35708 RepID=A0A0A9ALD9_ARUDO
MLCSIFLELADSVVWYNDQLCLLLNLNKSWQ